MGTVRFNPFHDHNYLPSPIPRFVAEDFGNEGKVFNDWTRNLHALSG